ncbi:MAG TPA: polynucleotide adenylyltransferase PcnB [Oligoflexia bacterium]|nr:polynucleotide adenylyltransferase PcnB [Oligoflexia bacterium]HMP49317.1 polynucleotide adenylyltransferase PcnB [Oligoflexia bacterium]
MTNRKSIQSVMPNPAKSGGKGNLDFKKKTVTSTPDSTSQNSTGTSQRVPEDLPGKPGIITRDHHVISRRNIDQDALKVLKRLNGYGYQAFLVGGGVRDLLLGKGPKDFDIGTNAKPEEIRELFRNSRIIGRRFKLVHVYFKGGKIIEVATFRSSASPDDPETLAHDNTYGDAESDALRRDLTINGLFYNAENFSVIDYVGGLSDLEKKVVRIIGDPDTRFTEDPVRILRAARHAARADFSVESRTSGSMRRNTHLIELVPSARLYEEFLKDFYSGALRKTFVRYRSYGIIKQVVPSLERALKDKSEIELDKFLTRLDYLDNLILSGKDPLSELFFAVLLIGNYKLSINPSTSDSSEDSGMEILCSEGFENSSNEDSDDSSNGAGLTENSEQSDFLNSSGGRQIKVPLFKLKPVRPDRNNRDRVSGLAKDLGLWFLPLTLTKREKIALERLLVIRHRVLTATSGDISSVSELLKSIHEEELMNLKYLMEIFNSDVPRGLRSIFSGPRRHSRRSRNR